jgi:glucose-1-phosphate adenylyltransferase
MRVGPRWFAGSADAIFQSLNTIGDEDPHYVVVVGSDHIYRMDVREMLQQHIAIGAGITISAIPVPIDTASNLGVIEAKGDGKIVNFLEKPEKAPAMPGNSKMAFASMGNYIFTRALLEEIVVEDSENEESGHDIGSDIIPLLVHRGQAHVYDFGTNEVPGQTEREKGYWRDVGSIDAYYDASMDLISVDPTFDLYNENWPVYSFQAPLPPAKFVHDQDDRRGTAIDSLVSKGVIVSGATVRRSILSPKVRVNSHALVEDSVLFDEVTIGRRAIVRRAIIDKGVVVPPGFRIGVNKTTDRRRFDVSPNGIVTIGKKDQLGS